MLPWHWTLYQGHHALHAQAPQKTMSEDRDSSLAAGLLLGPVRLPAALLCGRSSLSVLLQASYEGFTHQIARRDPARHAA